MMWLDSVQDVYNAEAFVLENGATFPRARLVYRTYGTLSAARDNAILFPTWFSSIDRQNEWLIGPGRPLDTTKYCIICPNLMGNGLSSSPSNTDPPFAGACFPEVSLLDNVILQRRLVRERLGITRLALVLGRSMGALTAFQWASYFPSEVARLLPFSGAARTSPHNYVFLDSVKAVICADANFAGGRPPREGLKAMGRIYAGWALSHTFYKEMLYKTEGAQDLDEYIRKRWEPNFVEKDAYDLLSQLSTWQRADISANPRFRGDFPTALAAIKARTIVMPCRTDMYFPAEDCAEAVMHMPNAELRVIESVWGHRAAAAGSDSRDIACLEAAIFDLLKDQSVR
jgi:homoserine O-acetyltransferase